MQFLERKDIWISHYTLRSRGFLNSVSSRRTFEGVLIRAGEGYGCIHPWPELGDPPLGKCLEDLRGRRFWPIVRRAMRCAEFDNAARSAEESLFEEMEIPRSHATLVKADAKALEAAVAAGFDTVKMKVGRALPGETAFLETMVTAFPQLRWRLDFNESLDLGTAETFLAGLSPVVRNAIDFIEDICPFSESAWEGLWKRHRLRLAVDRESGPHRKAAQVTIIKPSARRGGGDEWAGCGDDELHGSSSRPGLRCVGGGADRADPPRPHRDMRIADASPFRERPIRRSAG
jgi:O-succinylbenzoate synthase